MEAEEDVEVEERAPERRCRVPLMPSTLLDVVAISLPMVRSFIITFGSASTNRPRAIPSKAKNGDIGTGGTGDGAAGAADDAEAAAAEDEAAAALLPVADGFLECVD